MGLGDIAESAKDSSSRTSSGSSSGGSSRYTVKCPELVIKQTEDGYKTDTYPETMGIEFKDGEPDDGTPEHWVKVIWNKGHLRSLKSKVEKVTGDDLLQLAQTDPEKAVRALKQSAQQFDAEFNTSRRKGLLRNCGVCDEELNIVMDETEEVNNRVVCPDHSVTELREEDIL